MTIKKLLAQLNDETKTLINEILMKQGSPNASPDFYCLLQAAATLSKQSYANSEKNALHLSIKETLERKNRLDAKKQLIAFEKMTLLAISKENEAVLSLLAIGDYCRITQTTRFKISNQLRSTKLDEPSEKILSHLTNIIENLKPRLKTKLREKLPTSEKLEGLGQEFIDDTCSRTIAHHILLDNLNHELNKIEAQYSMLLNVNQEPIAEDIVSEYDTGIAILTAPKLLLMQHKIATILGEPSRLNTIKQKISLYSKNKSDDGDDDKESIDFQEKCGDHLSLLACFRLYGLESLSARRNLIAYNNVANENFYRDWNNKQEEVLKTLDPQQKFLDLLLEEFKALLKKPELAIDELLSQFKTLGGEKLLEKQANNWRKNILVACKDDKEQIFVAFKITLLEKLANRHTRVNKENDKVFDACLHQFCTSIARNISLRDITFICSLFQHRHLKAYHAKIATSILNNLVENRHLSMLQIDLFYYLIGKVGQYRLPELSDTCIKQLSLKSTNEQKTRLCELARDRGELHHFNIYPQNWISMTAIDAEQLLPGALNTNNRRLYHYLLKLSHSIQVHLKSTRLNPSKPNKITSIQKKQAIINRLYAIADKAYQRLTDSGSHYALCPKLIDRLSNPQNLLTNSDSSISIKTPKRLQDNIRANLQLLLKTGANSQDLIESEEATPRMLMQDIADGLDKKAETLDSAETIKELKAKAREIRKKYGLDKRSIYRNYLLALKLNTAIEVDNSGIHAESSETNLISAIQSTLFEDLSSNDQAKQEAAAYFIIDAHILLPKNKLLTHRKNQQLAGSAAAPNVNENLALQKLAIDELAKHPKALLALPAQSPLIISLIKKPGLKNFCGSLLDAAKGDFSSPILHDAINHLLVNANEEECEKAIREILQSIPEYNCSIEKSLNGFLFLSMLYDRNKNRNVLAAINNAAEAFLDSKTDIKKEKFTQALLSLITPNDKDKANQKRDTNNFKKLMAINCFRDLIRPLVKAQPLAAMKKKPAQASMKSRFRILSSANQLSIKALQSRKNPCLIDRHALKLLTLLDELGIPAAEYITKGIIVILSALQTNKLAPNKTDAEFLLEHCCNPDDLKHSDYITQTFTRDMQTDKQLVEAKLDSLEPAYTRHMAKNAKPVLSQFEFFKPEPKPSQTNAQLLIASLTQSA